MHGEGAADAAGEETIRVGGQDRSTGEKARAFSPPHPKYYIRPAYFSSSLPFGCKLYYQ